MWNKIEQKGQPSCSGEYWVVEGDDNVVKGYWDGSSWGDLAPTHWQEIEPPFAPDEFF